MGDDFKVIEEFKDVDPVSYDELVAEFEQNLKKLSSDIREYESGMGGGSAVSEETIPEQEMPEPQVEVQEPLPDPVEQAPVPEPAEIAPPNFDNRGLLEEDHLLAFFQDFNTRSHGNVENIRLTLDRWKHILERHVMETFIPNTSAEVSTVFDGTPAEYMGYLSEAVGSKRVSDELKTILTSRNPPSQVEISPTIRGQKFDLIVNINPEGLSIHTFHAKGPHHTNRFVQYRRNN